MTTIREERLDNGLQIRFVDETNRYFGDYHRVSIQVNLVYVLDALPLSVKENQTFRDDAIASLGKELKVVKRLERMGVSTADVEIVRQSLMEAFLKNSLSYFSRPEYPLSLVDAELKKRRTHCFYG